MSHFAEDNEDYCDTPLVVGEQSVTMATEWVCSTPNQSELSDVIAACSEQIKQAYEQGRQDVTFSLPPRVEFVLLWKSRIGLNKDSPGTRD
jgi:hypothetical protein